MVNKKTAASHKKLSGSCTSPELVHTGDKKHLPELDSKVPPSGEKINT
ncbi:hypothetical protein [Varibaculum massiliense]|nr:hypothetical protein [Varibaculum massiliense]